MGLLFGKKRGTDVEVKRNEAGNMNREERDYMNCKENHSMKKILCIRSAQDFEKLVASIPQKDRALRKSRRTFYGKIPCSAREMAEHTNRTTAYYANGLGLAFENEGGLLENRKRLFAAIESAPKFLLPRVHEASDGELWTLRKLLRRVLWHDRIHAYALWRHAITFWQKERIANPFFFTAEK